MGVDCVRLWLILLLWYCLARFGSDRRSETINSALLTPGYLLALLNTLHPVREMYQVG